MHPEEEEEFGKGERAQNWRTIKGGDKKKNNERNSDIKFKQRSKQK